MSITALCAIVPNQIDCQITLYTYRVLEFYYLFQGFPNTQSLCNGSDECESMAGPMRFPAIINLNIGGRKFTTNLSTLTKDPNSMLAAMFSGRHPILKNQDGRWWYICPYSELSTVREVAANQHGCGGVQLCCVFTIQSLLKEMKLFESVICRMYLEKAKEYYPTY